MRAEGLEERVVDVGFDIGDYIGRMTDMIGSPERASKHELIKAISLQESKLE